MFCIHKPEFKSIMIPLLQKKWLQNEKPWDTEKLEFLIFYLAHMSQQMILKQICVFR